MGSSAAVGEAGLRTAAVGATAAVGVAVAISAADDVVRAPEWRATNAACSSLGGELSPPRNGMLSPLSTDNTAVADVYAR